MATIPNPELERRSIPTPGTRIASADVRGVGEGAIALGGGMSDLSDDLFQIQVAEKKRVDDLKIDDAFIQYKKHLIDLQVGENGYQKVKGKGVTENQFLDGYKGMATSKIDEIASTLGNEDQRESFKRQAKNASLGFELDLMNHAMREEEVAAAGVLAGTVDVAVTEAQHNWFDDAKIDAAKLKIIDQANKFYDGRGKSPEEKKAFIDEAISQIDSQIAYQLIEAEDFETVDKKMKGWEKTIDSNELLRIKAKLKERKNRTAARRKADEIMGSADEYGEQIKLARKIEDTDLRAKTTELLDSENIRKNNIRTTAIKETTDELTNQIIDSPDLATALEIADEAEELSGVLRKELRAYATALKSGGPTHSEIGAREEARARIDGQSFKDPETGEIIEPITDMNRLLIEYAPRLKKSDLDAVVKYMEGGGVQGTLTDSEVRTMFKNVTGKDAKDEPHAYSRAWDYISSRAKPNQKFTDDELRKMMTRVTTAGLRVPEFGERGYPFFGGAFTEGLTYSEAAARGVLEDWYPKVADEEEDIIDAGIERYNAAAQKYNETASVESQQYIIPAKTETGRSFYKKHFMLMVPFPQGEGE
jgi:hypothetical protein